MAVGVVEADAPEVLAELQWELRELGLLKVEQQDLWVGAVYEDQDLLVALGPDLLNEACARESTVFQTVLQFFKIGSQVDDAQLPLFVWLWMLPIHC